MAQVPPRVERFEPPDPAAQAEARERWEQFRVEHEERRQRLLPLRRLVLAAGPALRDLEAALECVCSCHPSAGDPDLHEHGVRCPCQLTPEERAEAFESFLSLRDDLGPDPFGFEEFASDVEGRAFALGVELSVVSPGGPLVVSGVVDGRGCFLRERHGFFHVEVAPGDAPLRDVWRKGPEEVSLVVAEGSESELEPAPGVKPGEQVVDVLVAAVRTFLLQEACTHPGQVRFCPHCGAPAPEQSV